MVALLQRVADQAQPRAEPCCFLERTIRGGEQAGDFILNRMDETRRGGSQCRRRAPLPARGGEE
jgi:hypothetical protein